VSGRADDGGEARALRQRVVEAVGAVFDIEDELGRGGMAVVYRAMDRRLRRRVALKVLPPDLAFRADVRSRFVREAQMAARLSHPHIVPIYAVDETGGLVWFAMGLVEGESLARRLAREPRLDISTVRRILREVAGGLACAHEQGVVHRDIKPDNILLDRSTGRALVTDFGIARAAEGDLRLTATGVAVGTPAYMSPEQAMGEKDVDGRADIYALGVVGWQMLAGELPFQAENTPGMLMKHISEAPRPLSGLRNGLPANLVYAIERAMAKSRADRWPDGAAFADALDERAEAPPAAFSNAHTPPGVPAVLHAEPGSLGGPAVDAGAPPGAAAVGGPRGPSASKPWRFDPMRAAAQSDTGAHAIREWREQRQAWRERYRPAPIDHEPLTRRERRELHREERARREAALTPEERIRSLQRAVARATVFTTFLAMLNFFTSPQFPWFIFPALAMGLGVASRIGSLWVDGIPLRRLFRRQPVVGADEAVAPESGPLRPHRKGAKPAPRLPAPNLAGVPTDVLDGPHGATVREAAESRMLIADIVARLPDHERFTLPDVNATAAALDDKVRALATALHQLDRDASPTALHRLEQKLAEARTSPGDAAERERRVMLLERQQATLRDLAERRDAVAHQLENAALLMQTMKLDLMRLRSSDVESRLADSTLATQEARAVATDIERLVDAAKEVRKL
jgi:serine/threonine-protein kinase